MTARRDETQYSVLSTIPTIGICLVLSFPRKRKYPTISVNDESAFSFETELRFVRALKDIIRQIVVQIYFPEKPNIVTILQAPS